MRKLSLAVAALALFIGAGVAYAAPQANVFRTLLPETTNTYDLGSSTTTWRNLYVNSCTGCGSGGGGSGNSAWTIGSGLIYNATSTDSVLIGTSTPTSATLYLQGTAGKNPLTIASSTGTSLLTVTQAGSVGLSSGTNSAAGLSLYFLSNTNSGLYLPTSNEISFVAGGAERLNLTSQGLKLNTTDTAAAPSIFYNGDSNTGLSHPAADNIGLSTNGLSRLFVDSSGNVGIGTTAPVSLFNVAGTPTATSSYGLISLGNGAFDGNISTGFIGSATGTVLAVNTPTAYTGNLLDLQRNGASALSVTASGNVGIGNINPTTALQIGSGSGATTKKQLFWSTYQSSGGTTGFPQFLGNNNGSNYWGIGYSQDSNPVGALTFGFVTAPNAEWSSRAMVITQTGNVGIGTTSPGALLDVFGGKTFMGGAVEFLDGTVNIKPLTTGTAGLVLGSQSGQTSDPFQLKSSGGTVLVNMTAGGNVGIATTSPASKLHVSYDATSTASTLFTLQLGTVGLTSPSANGTYVGANAPASFSGNFLEYQLNGSSKFKVTSSGAVTTGGNITMPGNSALLTANQTYVQIGGMSQTTSGSKIDVLLSPSTFTNTSGTNAAVQINPTYNQSASTASNTDLQILRVETSLGSGNQYLLQAGTSTAASLFVITNTGKVGIGTGTPDKTLTINGVYGPVVSATTTISTAAYTMNLSSNSLSFSLATTSTITFSNVLSDASYRIWLKQDSTGSRVPTFSNCTWYGGAPTFSTAANKVDIVVVNYNAAFNVYACQAAVSP